MPTQAVARTWLDRWDHQQELYMADREERFAVMADVVDAVIDRPDPLILDLGCGPGSTSVRMLDRLPRRRGGGPGRRPVPARPGACRLR